MSLVNMILYRMPVMADQNCPICGNSVTKKVLAYVVAKGLDDQRWLLQKIEVLFCSKCGIPFANTLFMNQIRYERGCQPQTFFSRIRDHIIRELDNVPNGVSKDLKKIKELPFSIVEGVITGKMDPVRIVCNHVFDKRCLICGYHLGKLDLKVPVSVTHQAVMRGKVCPKCRIFYTRHSRWSIRKLLENNQYASSFVFDETCAADGLVMEKQEKIDAEIRKQWKIEREKKALVWAEKARIQRENEAAEQQLKNKRETEFIQSFPHKWL